MAGGPLTRPSRLHRWAAEGDYSNGRMALFLTVRAVQIIALVWIIVLVLSRW